MPRGRENRGRPLTDEHIASAILGLVAAQPGWSGHVATILKNLKPVGGRTEAFGGVATITDALSNLLAVEASRASIIAVRLSVAEIGTNSNGIAVITYERDKKGMSWSSCVARRCRYYSRVRNTMRRCVMQRLAGNWF